MAKNKVVQKRKKEELAPDDARATHEFYATRPKLALKICRVLQDEILPSDPGVIIEPSAGDGVFAEAARAVWGAAPYVYAVEPRPNAGVFKLVHSVSKAECRTWEDAADTSKAMLDLARAKGSTRLIVGNPPFTLAERHVGIAMERLRHAEEPAPTNAFVAFLLRGSFIATQDRYDTMFNPAPASAGLFGAMQALGGLRYVRNIVPRPPFEESNSTDGYEYALYVWQAGYRGRTYEGGWLDWRDE